MKETDNIQENTVEGSADRQVHHEQHTTACIPGFNRPCARDLIVSRMAGDALHDDAAVDRWIENQRRRLLLHAEIVPIDSLDQWRRDEITGNIAHCSGRFFTITGLAVRHRTRFGELEWDQPIIDQPEIGILGILAKKSTACFTSACRQRKNPAIFIPCSCRPRSRRRTAITRGCTGARCRTFSNTFSIRPATASCTASCRPRMAAGSCSNRTGT